MPPLLPQPVAYLDDAVLVPFLVDITVGFAAGHAACGELVLEGHRGRLLE